VTAWAPREIPLSRGHVFIVNGDLTKIACDALLVPTDGIVNITESWRMFLRNRTYPDRFASRVMAASPNPAREPHVWLGNLGQRRGSFGFSVFETTVREFVEKAIPELEKGRHQDRIYPWPKFRLAVNVIGSGYGGASQLKGELLGRLIAALDDLAVEYDVDIVLVAYGDKPYAAAQRARRQVVNLSDVSSTWQFHAKSTPELAQRAMNLADAAITRHLVLFVGAGVSAGAGAPTWKELLARIGRLAGFPPEALELLAAKDPRDQATLIERRLQDKNQELRTAIAAELGRTTRYSLQHGLLASLPSTEAVTTNFDDLFETAARTADRPLAVLPSDPRASNGQWLLKLHGSVERPESIVLTRSDFLDMPRQYGALIGLVQGMLLMRHMMFIGYSLQDEDFQELIHEVRKARGADDGGRHGTVLTLFDDELEREIWAKDLDVVPMIAGSSQTTTVEVAARELELFLDLIGFLSTTSAAFFLDPTYSHLSDDEAPLRDALHRLAAMTSTARNDSVAFLVKRFLEGLGSTGP
jgi:SIR2-like domain